MSELHDKTDIQGMKWNKIFLLGLMSLALCSFAPFSIFAPVPLALIGLNYGRNISIFVFALGLAVLGSLTAFIGISPVYMGIFFFAFIFSIVLTEIIKRQISPITGLIKGGASLLLFFGLIFGAFLLFQEQSLTDSVKDMVVLNLEKVKVEQAELLKQGGEQARVLQEYIDHPEDLAKTIVKWVPFSLFVSIYFTLWVGLFVLLRNSLQWRYKVKYPFGVRDFSRFKMPDYFVWPVIVSLGLTLAGVEIVGEVGELIGLNLLYSLGLFYFFQGFGIYLDFLNYLRIYGFFRSILVFTTLFMAFRMLVIVGLFDMWVDFRKFFKKKNIEEEGDK